MSTDISPEKLASEFDHNYFSPTIQEDAKGYRGPYVDIPENIKFVKYIKYLNPENVLEAGCAFGFITKRLNDIGIDTEGFDISSFCYKMRVTNKIRVASALDLSCYNDKQFDLLFSNEMLEHIPEAYTDQALKELSRVSKRGVHWIAYKEVDDLFQTKDVTHVNIKPYQWWVDKFEKICGDTHKVIRKETDWYPIPVNIPKPDSNNNNTKKGLNVGSFVNMLSNNEDTIWMNVDILDLETYARTYEYNFMKLDASKALPFPDNSYDYVVASHFIEHITLEEGQTFLTECNRILKPNGIIRLAVPDSELLIKKYVDNTLDYFDEINPTCDNAKNGLDKLNALLWSNHKSIYDKNTLTDALKKAGFNTTVKSFNESLRPDLITQMFDFHANLSIYMEGVPIKDIIKTIGGIGRKEWLHQNIKLCEKVLDIGSNDGFIFRGTNFNVTSVDIDKYEFPGFIQMDAHNLQFADNSFDVAVLGDMLEHVTDPIQVMKEANRVANRIVFTVPDEVNWTKEHSPNETVEQMIKRLGITLEEAIKVSNPNAIEFYTEDDRKHLWHNRRYIENTLRQDLESAGIRDYKLERLKYDGWSFFVVNSTKKKLKIALISTPFLKTPPDHYGGLEMVVADLAVGLAKLGHDVTLFATKGSKPIGNYKVFETIDPIFNYSTDWSKIDWFEMEKRHYETFKDVIKSENENFDIIHDHTWFAFPYLSKIEQINLKVCHSHHGGINWDSSPPIKYPNFITISDFMRQYSENYFKSKGYNVRVQFVHNGIDLDKYPYKADKGNRLIFVGRFVQFKGPHVAIEIAKKLDMGLDLVGGAYEEPYFSQQIKHHCDGKQIILHTEISHDAKIELLQNAKALIFPSKMNEPYGLVALEAMACGTPVIALRDGGIAEVVIHNETGFICTNISDMIEALKNIHTIDPKNCRKRAEQLSRQYMAENYLKLYINTINNREW